jgi:hypothetical protein
MLIAGGTRTLTRQYGTLAGAAVVPVDTDVIVADESFGGVVVGRVGRSEMRCTLPMPAVSQVSCGVLLTGVACAVERSEEVAWPVALEVSAEPPPPQPVTSAAKKVAQANAAAGRRGRFMDMPVSCSGRALGGRQRLESDGAIRFFCSPWIFRKPSGAYVSYRRFRRRALPLDRSTDVRDLGAGRP